MQNPFQWNHIHTVTIKAYSIFMPALLLMLRRHLRLQSCSCRPCLTLNRSLHPCRWPRVALRFRPHSSVKYEAILSPSYASCLCCDMRTFDTRASLLVVQYRFLLLSSCHLPPFQFQICLQFRCPGLCRSAVVCAAAGQLRLNGALITRP